MIFKFHYGLWYGGLVGIIPFMLNYATKYANATATDHGILYTILPFIALLAKPVVCSFADKYSAHHHCLLLFIFLALLGYGSLAIYPFIPDLIDNHKDIVWILYCLAAFVGNTSMCVVNSIGDSLAINSCQKKDISYGEYRLWGPVGFGIFGAIWGITSTVPSNLTYTPGIITMVVLLSVNILLIAFWKDRDEFKILDSVPNSQDSTNPINYGGVDGDLVSTSNGTGSNRGDINESSAKVSRVSLLCRLAKQHSSIFAYIFLFTFCGVMTGIHWQFFFRYLEDISKQSNENFSNIVRLVLPVQALGGELVFFMLSGIILKRLGPSMTLVTCLFSFAIRYLLYAYLIPNVNIYWILLVELFQGPAFGLMYCVLTHQAKYYSEKIDEIVAQSLSPGDIQLKNSLHATLQGILGAAFEGLGLGLGAFIGGRSYDVTPLLMWQLAGFSSLVVGIICLTITIVSAIIHSSRR